MKFTSVVGLWIAKRIPRGYWRVTRFFARRDQALWNLDLPLRLIPGKSLIGDLREPIFVQILRGGCFPHQLGEDLLFLKLLKPGDVVYDVGANIGYTPLLFQHAVGQTGEVVAFEPSPRAFRFLAKAAETESGIQVRNVALSDATGSLQFFETESLDTSSLEPIQGVIPFDVPVLTFDQAAVEGPFPTFVKVDVEGHEPAVFRGMHSTLAGDNPPTIVFEALTQTAFAETTEAIGASIHVPFHLYRISRRGGLLETSDPMGVNNYLAVPETQNWRLEGMVLPQPMVLKPLESTCR